MVLVVEMMMMMIPMMSSLMSVTMAMISLLREGISPADFCLPDSFSLSVVFHPAEAAERLLDDSPGLRIPKGDCTSKGSPGGGPGPPHHSQARPGVGPRLGMVRALLWLPFWLPPSSGEIGPSRWFPGCSDLREYGILTLRFPAEF